MMHLSAAYHHHSPIDTGYATVQYARAGIELQEATRNHSFLCRCKLKSSFAVLLRGYAPTQTANQGQQVVYT